MTPRAFQLRQDLDLLFWDTILQEDSTKAYQGFTTVLKWVSSEAGLSRSQYCALEEAYNAFTADLAKAAFVAGLQIGRDPFSLLLEPSGDDDQVVKGGRP